MKQLYFEKLNNVRDLGGTLVAQGSAIKDGLLLRSDQLFFATDSDIAKLAALGVRKIVDFRSTKEREQKPDRGLDGAVNLHLPIIEDLRAGITRDSGSDESILRMLSRGKEVSLAMVDGYMGKMYRTFVSEPFAVSQYARFIDEVVESAQRDEAILWHCTAGKDRAGFATAIVLWTLGASRNDIVEDYLMTNERLADMTEYFVGSLAERLTTESARAALRRFFCADESFLDAAFDEAEKCYGSFDAYCENALGIDETKRALLVELLCEMR